MMIYAFGVQPFGLSLLHMGRVLSLGHHTPRSGTASKNIHGIETHIPRQTIGGGSLRNHFLLLLVPCPQQEPAGAIQECRDNRQASGNGISLDVT